MVKEITVCSDYLLIPVRTEEENKKLSIYEGETKLYEFAVPVGEGGESYAFHYYAAVPVSEWKGKRITVGGDVPESFLDALALSDSIPHNKQQHPLVHFAPDTGWLNDPNGMIYHEGVYHLFFQHNPFDVRWENMSWGHAVSSDLLHWRQKEDALFPDEDGTMYSGCGIVNERGELGLGKEAEIFFYTCAGNQSAWSKGKKFVQKAAYSLNHGESLVKLDGCILEHLVGENRDPKIYWHEKRGVYYMALYLDGNEYAILNSKDLAHWETTQKLTLARAWECPDLREIPVEGGGSRWMFWSADGYYFLGDFDGSRFETDGICHEAYQSMLPYAAQTFWGPERVIMIPWMRTNNKGKIYRGMMGIPRQLTLVERDGDYLLRQKLVDEWEEKKEKVFDWRPGKEGGCGTESHCARYEQKQRAAVEVIVWLEENADFTVDIYGTACTYEAQKAALKMEGIAERSEGVKAAVRLGDKEGMSEEEPEIRYVRLNGSLAGEAGKGKKVSFLSDGEILEVTVDDGLACGAFETKVDAMGGEIRMQVNAEARIEIFQVMETGKA